jgi:hypothetical protein
MIEDLRAEVQIWLRICVLRAVAEERGGVSELRCGHAAL